jgi:hypothetical protein
MAGHGQHSVDRLLVEPADGGFGRQSVSSRSGRVSGSVGSILSERLVNVGRRQYARREWDRSRLNLAVVARPILAFVMHARHRCERYQRR